MGRPDGSGPGTHARWIWLGLPQEGPPVGGCGKSAAPGQAIEVRLPGGAEGCTVSRSARRRRIRSHWLPVRRKGMAIQSGRCLLLGDAAGLVDPVTGEGIYNAVRSARMAAPVIGQLPAGPAAPACGIRVSGGQRDNAGTEGGQGAGQGLCLVSRGWSSMRYGANDRLWNACCRLLRGEDTYITLKRRLGPAQVIFDLLTF